MFRDFCGWGWGYRERGACIRRLRRHGGRRRGEAQGGSPGLRAVCRGRDMLRGALTSGGRHWGPHGGRWAVGAGLRGCSMGRRRLWTGMAVYWRHGGGVSVASNSGGQALHQQATRLIALANRSPVCGEEAVTGAGQPLPVTAPNTPRGAPPAGSDASRRQRHQARSSPSPCPPAQP